MPRYSPIEEAREKERLAPKLKAAIVAQKKREKNGKWVLVTGDFKEYYKFVSNESTCKNS